MIPRNAFWYHLAYTVAMVVYGGYALSLWLRRRWLRRRE